MRRRLLGALACATMTAASATELPPSVPIAGFARYEFNKWLFRACVGTGRTATLLARGLPIIDATPERALFSAIQQRWEQAADPLRGVYLEFAGYVETGRVTATDLQRSLGWVESCAQRPTNIPAGARLWAAGNEPGWSFVLDGANATFRTPDQVLSFPARPLAQSSGAIAYAADHQGTQIRIEFAPGLCSDTMSEAVFGRRVVVALRGALYTGCGLVR